MALSPASSRGVDLATANAWTANQTAPAWIASGLTGATAASRYVGATASGAPGSGTFAIGDFIIDQTGKLYVCTVAGSPGTWTQVGGSTGVTQLAYAELTSSVSVTATSEGTPTDILASGAFAADGATRVHVTAWFPRVALGATAGTQLTVFLREGATVLGELSLMEDPAAAVLRTVCFFGSRYLTPTNASHTYTISAYKAGGSSNSVAGGLGGTGAALPGYIRVTSGG